MRITDKRSLKQTAAILLGYALVTCYGCASNGVRTRAKEAQPAPTANWAPCTLEIRRANCNWTGSYPHVRRQHCGQDCGASGESQYRAGFIDTCNDSRLAEVCFTTVQNDGCQYYYNAGRGSYVVSSNLSVVVGSDKNRQCNDSTVTTVVLDEDMKVITMYPGPG